MTWGDPAWVGPAAIVNAHRFLFDSRDQGAAERLAILRDRCGVFRCRTVFNCTECCPRGIPVTDLITDIATRWTECLLLLSKSAEATLSALQQARACFPFPILGLDTDNGSEFINVVAFLRVPLCCYAPLFQI